MNETYEATTHKIYITVIIIVEILSNPLIFTPSLTNVSTAKQAKLVAI